jgi:hypothetical protein
MLPYTAHDKWPLGERLQAPVVGIIPEANQRLHNSYIEHRTSACKTPRIARLNFGPTQATIRSLT